MLPAFRLLAVLALSFFSLALRAQHPPPGTAQQSYHYAATESSCAMDPNYVPVPHPGLADISRIFSRLARSQGFDPADFSLELMKDKRGIRQINAMTCPQSQVIWVSVTAWERLQHNEVALTLLLAHELAHAGLRPLVSLRQDVMTGAEEQLLATLTNRQLLEVAADQQAADILVAAGYSIYDINAASHFIMASDVAGLLAAATPTHPAGRDRQNLLTYYLARQYLPEPTEGVLAKRK